MRTHLLAASALTLAVSTALLAVAAPSQAATAPTRTVRIYSGPIAAQHSKTLHVPTPAGRTVTIHVTARTKRAVTITAWTPGHARTTWTAQRVPAHTTRTFTRRITLSRQNTFNVAATRATTLIVTAVVLAPVKPVPAPAHTVVHLPYLSDSADPDPVTTALAVPRPGGTATAAFTGTAGQRIGVSVLNGSLDPNDVAALTLTDVTSQNIIKTLVLTGPVIPATGYTLRLPHAGDYRLTFDAADDTTGVGKVAVAITEAHPLGTLVIGQGGITIGLPARYGTQAVAGVQGTAGEAVQLSYEDGRTTDGTPIAAQALTATVVTGPDGTTLTDTGSYRTTSSAGMTITLPEDGYYTIGYVPANADGVNGLTLTATDLADATNDATSS